MSDGFVQSLGFHYPVRLTLVSDSPSDVGFLSVFHHESSTTDIVPMGGSVTLSKVGPYYNENLTFTFTLSNPSPSCDDDSDCEKGEKCVDGDCVPCDKLVDGKGLVTLWGVKRSDGTVMSDALLVDISSGASSVQLSNFDSSYLTAGRIQISNGMSGTLTVKAGIGILGSIS